MKFQKNLHFGPLTEEVKLEVYNALERTIFDVVCELKEALRCNYRKEDGEKFVFFDQESLSEKTIADKRREAFVSSRYEELYNLQDGESYTTDENMIHSFRGENGLMVNVTRMHEGGDSLVYLEVECNSVEVLRIIQNSCEKYFSFMSYTNVIELIKKRNLTTKICLFMLSIEASSHDSPLDEVVALYTRALHSEKKEIVENALYCIAFDESERRVYAEFFQDKVLEMKAGNKDGNMDSIYDFVIGEIQDRLS